MSEVAISQAEMKELTCSALEDAAAYRLSLETAIVHVAASLRNGAVDSANGALHEVFEGIKLFVGILRGVELSAAASGAGSLSAIEGLLEEMKPTLETVIEAQTDSDWPLLADVLEYELTATLTGFDPVIADLRGKVRSE